jgi:hypothetical protein
MAGDNGSVTPVTIDGLPVGHVFGTGCRFYFLLDERVAVDVPRGAFRSEEEAVTACEHQARCLAMADQWDARMMMLDT